MDAAQIAQLRAQGLSWKKIAKAMGLVNSLPHRSSEQAYLLIIFRLVAAIVIVPPASVTSPVSSTLWLI